MENNFSTKKDKKYETNISTSYEHDRVISMLEKTGCLELHFKVEDCMVENKDWRMCQDSLKKLQLCLQTHHNSIHTSKESM